MKHKHCDLIKAWADGAKIEYFCPYLRRWEEVLNPAWEPSTQYRIKKESVKKWLFAVCGQKDGSHWFVTSEHYTEQEVKTYLSANYIKIPQTEIEVEV